MQKLIVESKYNNKKLSSFLYSHFDGLTSNTFYKALRKKDIRINEIKTNEDKIIHEFDTITIFIPDNLLFENTTIKKIYEDNNILVINKPVNIEVISSTDKKSISSILEKQYSYIKPCHRLDRNTTGLVLFAKNSESLEILLEKFRTKEIKKNYYAVVIGRMPKKEELLKAYLFKDKKKSLVYISDSPKKGYQEILTKYSVISENKTNNTSILNIELITGKTHQIRAHLAHIGHPILGDGKYGINKINKEFKYKYQLLENYKLEFSFSTSARNLQYLNNKVIKIPDNDSFIKNFNNF